MKEKMMKWRCPFLTCINLERPTVTIQFSAFTTIPLSPLKPPSYTSLAIDISTGRITAIMSSLEAEASTSTSSTINEDVKLLDEAKQEEALIAEEQDIEHYCFLAKYASTSMEVRLAVDDSVTELKAVSSIRNRRFNSLMNFSRNDYHTDSSRCPLSHLLDPILLDRHTARETKDLGAGKGEVGRR
jgi:uncharacterized protein YqiB (DUF1249 family)